MCKIIIFSNLAKFTKFEEVPEKMRELLADQRDGFGYAVQNRDNSVFGVRTLRPLMRLDKNGIPWCDDYPVQYFGQKLVGDLKGGLFHGRISTNSVSLLNTHPISKEGWHLIHNGVVQDQAPGAKQKVRVTTNDSEYVLDHLREGGIKAVSENLTGYYAVGAFSPDGTMHVFRDNTARLQCAYSDKLESFIFATTDDLLDKIGEWVGEKLWPVCMKPNTYVKFMNGAPVGDPESFTSLGYSWNESKYASRSLGYELPYYNQDWSKPDPAESKAKEVKTDFTRTEREHFVEKVAKRNAVMWEGDNIKASRRDWDLLDRLRDDFIDLMPYIDDSYRITTPSGKTLNATEFSNLRLVDKVKCFIVDANGRAIPKYAVTRKKQKNKGARHVAKQS